PESGSDRCPRRYRRDSTEQNLHHAGGIGSATDGTRVGGFGYLSEGLQVEGRNACMSAWYRRRMARKETAMIANGIQVALEDFLSPDERSAIQARRQRFERNWAWLEAH